MKAEDVTLMTHDFKRLIELKNPDADKDDIMRRLCLMLRWQAYGQRFPKNYYDISIDEKDLELQDG